jgi:hypothetical protein
MKKAKKLHTEIEPQKTGICFSRKFDVQAPSPSTGNHYVLKDVRIVEEGPARGHGVWLDARFVDTIVTLAAGRMIKCRLGHPDMCKESMGTYVGYYNNFRTVSDANGTYAVADLNVSQASNKSPNGTLGDYIVELAQEAPTMFGNSIEFMPGETYYKTDKGHDVYRDYSEEGTGYKLGTGEAYDKSLHGNINRNKEYVECSAFENSDLVDEAAATSQLFSGGLLSQIKSLFGGGYPAAKKTALLKNIVRNMTFSQINATTNDGSAIIVESENEFIGIGDSVMMPDGTPQPDGEYVIAESDSGQTDTITVVGGMITNIAQTITEPAAPTEQVAASETAANEALSAALSTAQTQLAEAIARSASLETQLNAANEKIAALSKLPIANPIANNQGTEKGKNKYQSPTFDK